MPFKFHKTIPLSLYIHIPWCVRKCPYCDFNSHELKSDIPEEHYIQALLDDLDEHLAKIEGRSLTSIFFGGGTPSLFTGKAIEKILTGVNARLPFGENLEITLEANPGTIDEARFKDFVVAGINRLSIGVQSLQDEKLKALGRIHDGASALRAIAAATNAGFKNINIDLMYGLPQQTVEEALQDLLDAIHFEPSHLSWYQLTLEPNTFFYHQPPVLPQEDTVAEIEQAGQACLSKAGFMQYEVSAYAQSGQACLHNKNYWEFGDYLGIGAGAHSKLTLPDEGIIRRHWQVKNPKDYLDASKKRIAREVNLSSEESIFEFMLNALRLKQGVPLYLFTERAGLPLRAIEPLLAMARSSQLLETNPTYLCASELGYRFLNDLVGLFLPRDKRGL